MVSTAELVPVTEQSIGIMDYWCFRTSMALGCQIKSLLKRQSFKIYLLPVSLQKRFHLRKHSGRSNKILPSQFVYVTTLFFLFVLVIYYSPFCSFMSPRSRFSSLSRRPVPDGVDHHKTLNKARLPFTSTTLSIDW